MNTPVKHNEATIAQAKADADRFLSTVEIHIQHCGSIPTAKLEHLWAFRIIRDALACAEADLAEANETASGLRGLDILNESLLAQERQRAEKAESEIAKMLVRVNGRSDESESCPFCTRISMDATSQQCPMCHLCEIESSLETERQRREKAEIEAETQKTARKDMDRVATIWAERAEKAERELAEALKDIADITEVWGHQITDYLEARHATREAGKGRS